jgi:GNAT superfamily N-acetyltransferase
MSPSSTDTGQAHAANDPAHSRLVALARSAVEGFRSLCLPANGGPVDIVEGALCWHSTSSVPVFNGACLLSEHLINPTTLRAIDLYFSELSRGHSIITLDALVPGAVRLLTACGYLEYDYMPAMWLEGPPYEWEGQPEQMAESGTATPLTAVDRSITIVQIHTAEELAAFRTILSHAFHLPASEVRLILNEATLNLPHVKHYLAYWEGEPVGTLTMVLAEGVAGIWNVGTMTGYRRRGVATHLMRHALGEAHRLGHHSSMLLASMEGQPLYIRLGYVTLSMLRVFVPGAC